jgi:hypothetical protein
MRTRARAKIGTKKRTRTARVKIGTKKRTRTHRQRARATGAKIGTTAKAIGAKKGARGAKKGAKKGATVTRHTRRVKQRGGANPFIPPFKQSDFGTYDYDEYMEVDPEQRELSDEGYEPDILAPKLEYNGQMYDIYTDIDERYNYINLIGDDGESYMVKTKAVNRVKNTTF